MFMESLAAILITFPVLLPVATAVAWNRSTLLMAILNLMLGLTTPPVGMCVRAQIGKDLAKAFKATISSSQRHLSTKPFIFVLMLVSFIHSLHCGIPSILN